MLRDADISLFNTVTGSKDPGAEALMQKVDLPIPEAWSLLFREIAACPGCVFMLGASDTGKSTLARFLCSQSIEAGFRTAFLDADPGQSIIGPPTTLGMLLPSAPPQTTERLGWDYLYFIGATSPANHLPATAAGVVKLMRKAEEQGARMVVVDTTGLVTGATGFELKFHKIELLHPQHIVAIQRAGEVEHILTAVQAGKGIKIHRLSPLREVNIRSPETRQAYRQQRFQEYFQGCACRRISLDAVAFILPEPFLAAVEGQYEGLQGHVLGLNDADCFTRGLGIWAGFDQQRNPEPKPKPKVALWPVALWPVALWPVALWPVTPWSEPPSGSEVMVRTPLKDLSDIRYLLLGETTFTVIE
jgi:polynucleotide 5'-hydroxyl-kinase GRC3/NOL9